ncbi:MAG: shikimate kinase [Bacteroidia bacterium]
MNIFLIGYMGSGKSTVGKKLATKLNRPFIDLDQYLEKKENRSIAEIFETEGEGKFREKERVYLQEICAQDNTIVALGGGTVCFFDNLKLIHSHGISIYLKASVDTIFNRLKNAKTKRPLLEKFSSDEEFKEYISIHLSSRETFYSQATYKVKAKNINVDELVLFLIKEGC